MDAAATRLVAEADHLVRRARWLAERGIPADAHAAGRCLRCGTWIFAMNSRDWRRAVKAPCPACGMGW